MNYFCTTFLNTPRGPGHPGKIPGTSQVPPFQTQGRQTFKGGRKLFDHHPFPWKTPTPPGSLRPPKVNLVPFFLIGSISPFGVFFSPPHFSVCFGSNLGNIP